MNFEAFYLTNVNNYCLCQSWCYNNRYITFALKIEKQHAIASGLFETQLNKKK